MEIFSYPESQEHRKAHLEILKSFESYKDVNLTDADIKKLREQPMQAILEQIHSQDVRFAAHIKRNKERLGIS
jgi:hemerythrin